MRPLNQFRLRSGTAPAGGDAACSTVILSTDDPVERLHRVGATVALARVATVAVAGPPCLGAGALA